MELFLKKKYQYSLEVKIRKQVDHNYPLRVRFKLKNKATRQRKHQEVEFFAACAYYSYKL